MVIFKQLHVGLKPPAQQPVEDSRWDLAKVEKEGSPRLGDKSRLQLPGVAKAGSTEVQIIYTRTNCESSPPPSYSQIRSPMPHEAYSWT